MLRFARLAAVAIAPLAALSAQTPAAADLILHNATVYTVDPGRPIAQAIAVRGTHIAAVGEDAAVLRLRSASTRVVDAAGATVVPGLQDAHGHVGGLGANLQTLDFRGTSSFEQVVGRVRQRVASTPAGQWIVGRGWDQNDWVDKAWPTHELLSAISPSTRSTSRASMATPRSPTAGRWRRPA